MAKIASEVAYVYKMNYKNEDVSAQPIGGMFRGKCKHRYEKYGIIGGRNTYPGFFFMKFVVACNFILF